MFEAPGIGTIIETPQEFRSELPSELWPYLETGEHVWGGMALKHPLVFSLVPIVKERVLKALEYKKEAIDKYLEDGNILGYVFAHERPYRWQALDDVAWRIDSDEAMREILTSVWTDTEFPSVQDVWIIADFFRDAGYIGVDFEGTLDVYRGCGWDYTLGMSWTRSMDTAIWFARRFNDEDNRFICKLTVPREAVLAQFNERSENEVVVDPVWLHQHKDEIAIGPLNEASNARAAAAS